jgi:hypothetical protein
MTTATETYTEWQARWTVTLAAAQRQGKAAVRQAVRDMNAEAMRLWPEGSA